MSLGPAGPGRLPSRCPDWALALPRPGLLGACGGPCGLAKPWVGPRSSHDLRSGTVPQLEPLSGFGPPRILSEACLQGPGPSAEPPASLGWLPACAEGCGLIILSVLRAVYAWPQCLAKASVIMVQVFLRFAPFFSISPSALNTMV